MTAAAHRSEPLRLGKSKAYFTSCSKHSDAVPGALIAIQTFGDLLGCNPNLHMLISDGRFHPSEKLTMAPAIDTHSIEKLFRHKVRCSVTWSWFYGWKRQRWK